MGDEVLQVGRPLVRVHAPRHLDRVLDHVPEERLQAPAARGVSAPCLSASLDARELDTQAQRQGIVGGHDVAISARGHSRRRELVATPVSSVDESTRVERKQLALVDFDRRA